MGSYMCLNGENFYKVINWEKLAVNDQFDRKFMFLTKKNVPRGLSVPAWTIYIYMTIISPPEPSGSQGELIVYPYSGVRRRCRCRQQCLNIFSSETALPIKAKFYVEPPWEGGTKVYINGPGHMTKMAAMPI